MAEDDNHELEYQINFFIIRCPVCSGHSYVASIRGMTINNNANTKNNNNSLDIIQDIDHDEKLMGNGKLKDK